MTIFAVIRGYGFCLQVWEWDVALAEPITFRFRLFLGRIYPARIDVRCPRVSHA